MVRNRIILLCWWLVLFIFNSPSGVGGLLGILGVLALPYTLWSIYYQAFIAKEWCPLCVTIQVLIWVEFFIFLNIDFTSPISPIGAILSIGWVGVLTFVLTPLFWSFIKKPLQKSLHTDAIYQEFQKLKFDPNYIQALMSKEVYLPPIFEGMKTIEMGNPAAENNLVFVANLSCILCQQMYKAIDFFLDTNMNFNCKIILTTSNMQSEEVQKITQNILSINSNIEKNRLLKNWFSNNRDDVKSWAIKNDIIDNDIDGRTQLSFHLRWTTLAGIELTPTLFLNSIEIPKQYHINEVGKLLKASELKIN